MAAEKFNRDLAVHYFNSMNYWKRRALKLEEAIRWDLKEDELCLGDDRPTLMSIREAIKHDK